MSERASIPTGFVLYRHLLVVMVRPAGMVHWPVLLVRPVVVSTASAEGGAGQ